MRRGEKGQEFLDCQDRALFARVARGCLTSLFPLTQKTTASRATLQSNPSKHRAQHIATTASIMGGPGSGGYKSAPGDTETHSAWTIIAQDPESGQVSTLTRVKHDLEVLILIRSRNLHKCDASTVRGRWHSIPLVNVHISLAANSISTP